MVSTSTCDEVLRALCCAADGCEDTDTFSEIIGEWSNVSCVLDNVDCVVGVE